jgi:hypothetical protein
MTNQPGPSAPALFSNFRLLAFAPALLCALAIITTQSTQAQTLNVVYAFTGGAGGENPVYGVIFDRAGNLYGTTFGVGSSYGSVYELMRRDSSWIFQPLHNFQYGSEGYDPEGGVVFGPDGALYGATPYGGSICGGIYYFCGSVYSLRPSPNSCGNAFCPWNWTPAFVFGGDVNYGGYQPRSGVVFDSAGNIYGTTYYGGLHNNGTAFQLYRSQNGWRENVIDNFPSDVGYPESGLTFGAAGNLYGTSADAYYSRVYELVHTGQGWNERTIYVFQGGNDGSNPAAGLIFDAAGNAYGATAGVADGLSPGTVYQLSPQSDGTWQETVLYVFPPDIYGPLSNLAIDAAGNLYGTTPGTPGNNPDKWGMVFELSPVNGSWVFTQLHHFTNGTDGAGPSGVTLDSAGNLYGTCSAGGPYGWGLVWEITP